MTGYRFAVRLFDDTRLQIIYPPLWSTVTVLVARYLGFAENRERSLEDEIANRSSRVSGRGKKKNVSRNSNRSRFTTLFPG